MLTDVFIARYDETPIWSSWGEAPRRFMVQATKLLTEQLFPFYVDGTVDKVAQTTLQSLHDRLAMEIGIDPLSPLYVGSHRYNIADIIKNFMQRQFEDSFDVDVFIKRRISLVELAYRESERQVKAANVALSDKLERVAPGTPLHGLATSLRVQGLTADGIKAQNETLNRTFQSNVEELNERFRQAKFPLLYHNGFIQIAADDRVADVIEKPFWMIIAADEWRNVEHDMLEAFDRRDNGGRDPALYAARALESTIKIISDGRGFTRGRESGAAAYIDNLVSQTNGRFIAVWEGDCLKAFFSKVRNPLGHGPGGEEMPHLTVQQNNWALETCMSWIKSLIARY
ncbi:AbiJ-NTD4 domain-containing protein [Rhizobium leguminosarum]|uniref:AbiJ-NTD4 domain-containing protein n=1 Tax=Rhizobium leguminosarum TaxID=384 RepID=UPI003F9C157A